MSFSPCLCSRASLQHQLSHCEQCQSNCRCRTPTLLLATQLACAHTSDDFLLVFVKHLKTLTKAADVCSAACMWPDPDLPAFSMAPPPTVAQALLQYLALLLSALRQKLQEAKMIQSVALSALRRAERTRLKKQEQLATNLVAAALVKGLSRAPYQEVHGRPVPAGLPLHLKLTEPTVKDLVGEIVAVAPFGSACIGHIGWAMFLALPSCTDSCKVLWKACASINSVSMNSCTWDINLNEPPVLKGNPICLELRSKERPLCLGLC